MQGLPVSAGHVGCALGICRIQLHRKDVGSWLLPSSTAGLYSPKQDSLMKDYPENFFLGLLDEHSNLFQLLLDLPDTAVQQLQLWFCSV